jgi:hypothetical protein
VPQQQKLDRKSAVGSAYCSVDSSPVRLESGEFDGSGRSQFTFGRPTQADPSHVAVELDRWFAEDFGHLAGCHSSAHLHLP